MPSHCECACDCVHTINGVKLDNEELASIRLAFKMLKKKDKSLKLQSVVADFDKDRKKKEYNKKKKEIKEHRKEILKEIKELKKELKTEVEDER